MAVCDGIVYKYVPNLYAPLATPWLVSFVFIGDMLVVSGDSTLKSVVSS